MDREKFSYALNRDTFLTSLGWKMLHFSFDDIQYRPEVCRMLLNLAVGPYLLKNQPGLGGSVSAAEREVLRLAWHLGGSVRPRDIAEHDSVNFRTARNRLNRLVDKGRLRPVTSGSYICRYELTDRSAEGLA
ncbi:hypothetical protein HMSSN139_39750 [Paenibacillus sp. HMSSN-139]|nr:hypothetical protein HMSSN139_39750 [Paenibacillus sp. HMSSN-139]